MSYRSRRRHRNPRRRSAGSWLSNIIPLALAGGAGYFFYSKYAANVSAGAAPGVGTIESTLSNLFSGIVNTVNTGFANLTGGASTKTLGAPTDTDSTSGISGFLSSLENGVND